MSLHARQQLKHLSDISTLLARFESVDETLPTVLSLMTRTLSVRGATLISNRSGRVLSTGWKAETTSPDRARRDEAHARTAYGYLTGTHSLGEKPDAATTRAQKTSRFSSKDLLAGMSEDERNNRLVLPLVVKGGPIFGALQVE